MIIKGGTIVNEGCVFRGDIVIEGGVIVGVYENEDENEDEDEVIDASGCYVLPGVIDSHVHFREPGLTANTLLPGRRAT